LNTNGLPLLFAEVFVETGVSVSTSFCSSCLGIFFAGWRLPVRVAAGAALPFFFDVCSSSLSSSVESSATSDFLFVRSIN
jgi:hypothetical protein